MQFTYALRLDNYLYYMSEWYMGLLIMYLHDDPVRTRTSPTGD